MSRCPADLSYSAEHEWMRAGDSRIARVGITDFAVEQLGDIVYVSLPTVGEQVAAGDSCGELESTKSVSAVYCPVSGVITAVNDALNDAPETINADPYGDGWLFEVELSADPEGLLDAEAYSALVGA